MKRVVVMLLMFSSFAAFAQIGEDQCIITVEDVVCSDDVVTFTVTATSDGIPHVVSGSSGISFNYIDDNMIQQSAISVYPASGTVFDNLQLTTPLVSGATCDDVVDQTLILRTLEGSLENEGYVYCSYNDIPVVFAAALPPAVPTLGEWGLIILSLFLVIFGVIGIRSKKSEILLS